MRGVLLAIALLICAQSLPVAAQAPGPAQLEIKPDQQGKLGQGKSLLAPRPKIDRAPPLYLAADSVSEDIDRNRVVAQGKVEIYYDGYIITADKAVFDQGANKLTVEGKAQIKAPNGQVTRADRMEANDDLREAFVKTLAKTGCTNNPRCMAPLVADDVVPKAQEPRPKP